jgi:hypothetical protein
MMAWNSSEYNEMVAVRDVQRLLAERLIERTPAQIRKKAKLMVAKYRLTYVSDAYEVMESVLLNNNPSPERWDVL